MIAFTASHFKRCMKLLIPEESKGLEVDRVDSTLKEEEVDTEDDCVTCTS